MDDMLKKEEIRPIASLLFRIKKNHFVQRPVCCFFFQNKYFVHLTHLHSSDLLTNDGGSSFNNNFIVYQNPPSKKKALQSAFLKGITRHQPMSV